MTTPWKACIPAGAHAQLEDAQVRHWASQNPVLPYASVSPYMNPQDFMRTDTYRSANANFVQNGFQPLPPDALMPMFQASVWQAGSHMRSRM